MFRLDGMVALVTGASRGIGRATALQMAERGATVWVTSRNLEGCKRVAEEIRAAGGESFARACDVADYEAVESLMQAILAQHGRLDVLVNNAGVIEPIGYIWQTDPAAWAESISINLVGVYNGCRAVLQHFKQAGQGVIINVSSGAAHKPKEGWSAYCAGKAGVAMLTQAIALEAASYGVRVYGFQPGVVDTQMQQEIRDSGINEVSRLRREDLADPHEPAHIICWLCSTDAAELAGEELSIRDASLRKRAGLAAYTGK